MCRISGAWDFSYHGQYNLSEVNLSMRDTLIHGGPDGAGEWKHPELPLTFGHRRLAIIELSPLGHQPMRFEHLTICFNGEIYNFNEIREELIRAGYSFSSHSDTEVILKAWHKWNSNCLKKFRGMWAFALWDDAEKQLILSRDRVGVKPLFWYHRQGLFLFASELKAFHAHPGFKAELNQEAIAEYMQYGYISAPRSIFKNTYKLNPGHILYLSETGKIRTESWWNPADYALQGLGERKDWLSRHPDAVRDELEDILKEAFNLRMVADVPVGMFLSGGIDSSLVTAILQSTAAQPVKTFTIGFKEKAFDESEWAGKVAKHLGTDHTMLTCVPEDARDILPALPHVYDEPFGDSSAIPTLLVSRLARKQVTVALSADAGDEQFFGYSYYPAVMNRWNKWGNNPIYPVVGMGMRMVSPALIQTILKSYSGASVSAADKFIKLRNLLGIRDRRVFYDTTVKLIVQDELPTLLKLAPEGLENIRMDNVGEYLRAGLSYPQEMMLADMRTYLPDDILVKVDRATMSVALEGREPFLDNKVMEYAARMPWELKYREGKSKWILRQILYKYIPKEWVDRPKQGFAVPINEWFKQDLKEYYHQYLNEDRIRREGIFVPETVTRMLKQYHSKDGMNAHKLWLLLNFQLWKEKYLA
jgi:asparagine synthase (glutamine-hydrolysing)